MLFYANNLIAMFTMICAKIHTVSPKAAHINDLVAASICLESPRAMISWYQFQIINQKQASPIVNHKYLFTSDIILNIEYSHSTCVWVFSTSHPITHSRVRRVTAFTLDRDSNKHGSNIHIIFFILIFVYILKSFMTKYLRPTDCCFLSVNESFIYAQLPIFGGVFV